ncbi:MAG: hypothetical protein RAP03_14990 [Candidatus Electryonea clarkiae]|nr:hypothetical protein [Candidatus Electryonea clarkiae]
MKTKYQKLIALALTAFLLSIFFNLIGIVATNETSRNFQIKKYNLEEIVETIENSGVNTEELSIVFSKKPPLIGHFFFTLVQCLIIVWVYNKFLHMINKYRISKNQALSDEKTLSE